MTQVPTELDERQRLYRRTLRVVVASQVFGGAGLAAGVTVGALLAEDMLGTDRFAGLPSGVFTLGSAAAALVVGRLSQRLGRRVGLTTGFLAGGVGAAGVVVAAGHSLADVGIVIGVRIGAMYLPSLVTGRLVDRVGRVPLSIASGVTLLLAGTVAALAPPDSMPVLIVALALLGLGWNFGLISGTAMIVDATPPVARAKTQGNVDVLIALSGATGGALSGIVVAGSSFAALSLGGGVLALLLIPVVAWSRRVPHVAAGQ